MQRPTFVVAVLAGLWAFAVPTTATAGTWLVTADTILDDGDLSHENDDVVVQGAVLTVNGAHAFSSLTVVRSASNSPGVVTHSAGFDNGSVRGMWLIVTGDAFVQSARLNLVASRIDANGKGYPSSTGPGEGEDGQSCAGGAGHGGAGGNANCGTAAGGGTYGSIFQPSQLGSGGGKDVDANIPGGAGGGVIRLTVLGTLEVDGVVSANGFPSPGNESGGGAGGSVWIECGELLGYGFITANGGSANTSYSGGGGGGRVAVYVDDSYFDDANIRAYGGNAARPGGAGTVCYRAVAGEPSTLIADNGGLAAEGHSLSTECRSFVLHQCESNTVILVIAEHLGFELSGDLAVDVTQPGVVEVEEDLTPSSLPKGAFVNSHFLHFDPLGNDLASAAISITFDSEILGVCVQDDTLNDSDYELQSKDFEYPDPEEPNAVHRGLELRSGDRYPDVITISEDRLTLTYTGSTEHWMDQIRVVTAGYISDCDGDGVEDAVAIVCYDEPDENFNLIPDTCESVFGDLDGDGAVTGSDIGLLLSDWGRCVRCGGDLNGDGIVDGSDLGLLLGAWAG